MTHTHCSNLPSKNPVVKYLTQIYRVKLSVYFLSVVLITGYGLPSAHADDAPQQAMYNTNYLTNLLHGVDASRLEYMVAQIAQGKVRRPAPKQPIWILNAETGVILHYQGQPSFTGQPAAQLVDDRGIRFGQQALDNAKNSKSGWLTIVLGGGTYRAFCKAQYPTVVCSLVTPD